MIPLFGIQGAAVATTVSYPSMLVFHLWSARASGFDPTSDLRLSRVAFTTAVTTGFIFLLASVIQFDYLALLVVPPVGFAVYATLSVLSGVVDPDELSDVRKYV